MKQRRTSIGRKLLAVVAVVGVGILSVGTTVEARRAPRATIDLAFTAPIGFTVDSGELISYVGTLDFGRGRVYGIAFFADPLNPPAALCGDWVQFSDRYEIYDSTDFYKVEGGEDDYFRPPAPIIEATEWGFGSFERNVFFGFGRVVGDPDVDGIRLFRHLDEGDHLFYRGKFVDDGMRFVGTFKVFNH
jgi:hypothetical protein